MILTRFIPIRENILTKSESIITYASLEVFEKDIISGQAMDHKQSYYLEPAKAILFMKNYLLTISLLIATSASLAQYHLSSLEPGSRLQYGIGGKLCVEVQKHGIHIRLGATAGIATPFLDKILYPTANLEWQFYEGGLGTWSGSGENKSKLTSDITASLQCTVGAWYQPDKLDGYKLSQRNEPLYYFTDLVQPSLQNPYMLSATVGTNLVFSFDNDKSRFQQVGFIGLHVEHFQFCYYNDGGGLQNLGIGDGEDRYYTGGGLLSLTLPNNLAVNTFTVSYHKYSGYTPKAFDLSSSINLSYVNYTNSDQQYYNKSFWNFSISSSKNGLAGFVRINNPYNRSDFQNTIHYSFGYSYHHIPYPRYYSYGLSYFNLYQQQGTR